MPNSHGGRRQGAGRKSRRPEWVALYAEINAERYDELRGLQEAWGCATIKETVERMIQQTCGDTGKESK